MSSRFILGLDIGTSSIKAVVAEQKKDGRLLPRYFAKHPSSGLRKGYIVDVAETGPAISRALADIRKFSGRVLKNIYVSVGTSQTKVQNSKGIVAVSRADSIIYKDDVERAIRACQAVNLGPNRMVVHNVIREYVVDGVGDIADPIELSGNRLEVSGLIIDAFSPHIKNIVRSIELAGGEIGGMVLSPIAASRCALSRAQKDLGVALIEIGAGTTGLVVYEESKLVGVAKFPVGAANISNDLSIGLKVPPAVGENVKLNYGYAVSRGVGSKEIVDMKKVYPEGRGNVSRRFISEIIESRLAEIFEFVNNDIKLMGKFGQLAGGVVLVGGGAKLPGLTDLATQELRLSAQVGLPIQEEWDVELTTFGEYFEDPEYITALGLVLCGKDQMGVPRALDFPGAGGIRTIFRYFLP